MNSNRKGVIDPLTLLVVATVLVVAYLIVPDWRPSNWAIFRKTPPTVALVKTETTLANQEAQKKQVDTQVKTAVDADHAQTVSQIRYSQQTSIGAAAALSKAPAASRTPEVVLAASLVARTNIGLAMAIGSLPADQQAEILGIVDQALSQAQGSVTEVITASNTALAAKDAQLQTTQSAKVELEKQIPVLLEKQKNLQTQVESTQAQVTTQTNAVVTYAKKLQAAADESGSFESTVIKVAIGLALLYFIVHFALPSLTQEFPASKVLAKVNQVTKSISSSHA